MNGEYRKGLRVSNAGRRMPYCQGLSFRAETLVLQISDTVSGGSKFSKSSEPPSRRPGLGLPLVGQIVSAYRGAVDYFSEPGKGTTLSLSLSSR